MLYILSLYDFGFYSDYCKRLKEKEEKQRASGEEK